MKELTGSASGTTAATPEQAMVLLEAIEGYPSWAPDVVKEAEVLERDAAGHPTQARTKLHVERGPLTRDFNLLLAVSVDPAGTIELRRIPHQPSDSERSARRRERFSLARDPARFEAERVRDQFVGAPARLVVVSDRDHDHLVGAVLGRDRLDLGPHLLG
jgi:hypothetical protein